MRQLYAVGLLRIVLRSENNILKTQSAFHKQECKIKGRIAIASTKDYLDFILEQLSCTEDVTYRKMMGEYILYYKGKVIGGIYDNRFLIKPTPSAKRLMPDALYEIPYDGGKEMLSVDNIEDKEFLCDLFEAMYDELPYPKSKK